MLRGTTKRFWSTCARKYQLFFFLLVKKPMKMHEQFGQIIDHGEEGHLNVIPLDGEEDGLTTQSSEREEGSSFEEYELIQIFLDLREDVEDFKVSHHLRDFITSYVFFNLHPQKIHLPEQPQPQETSKRKNRV
ncbi:unnamed protein product [Linum trigynum]